MVMLRHPANKSRAGFTIVELLIVVVVIGILAAITIITFSGIRSQAVQASLKSDLRNATAQLENDKTKGGAYPATAAASNEGSGIKRSPNTNIVYYNRTADDSYCVAMFAASSSSTSVYYSSREGSVKDGLCPNATVSQGGIGGGCTPTACRFVTVNTESFPAGSYSIQCLSNGSITSTTTRSLPVSGPTQLTCFIPTTGTNQVSVNIIGWGQTNTVTW